MICPECNNEIPADSDSCVGCGTKLAEALVDAVSGADTEAASDLRARLNTALQAGEDENALLLALKCQAADPDDVELAQLAQGLYERVERTYFSAAQALEAAGKLADAISMYSTYLGRYPAGPGAAEARHQTENVLPEKQKGRKILALLQDFQSLMAANSYPEAKMQGKELLASAAAVLDPDAPILDSGMSAAQAAELVTQEQARVGDLEGDLASLQDEAGEALAADDLPRAKDKLLRALELCPHDEATIASVDEIDRVSVHLEKAAAAFAKEDWEEADSQSTAALSLLPTHHEAQRLQSDAETFLAEAARRKQRQRRNTVYVPLAIIVFVLLGAWISAKVRFAWYVDAFETALAPPQDEALARRYAVQLADRYRPAGQFLTLMAARQKFEREHARMDQALLTDFGGDEGARLATYLAAARDAQNDLDTRTGFFEEALALLPDLAAAAREAKYAHIMTAAMAALNDAKPAVAAQLFAEAQVVPGHEKDPRAREGERKARENLSQLEKTAEKRRAQLDTALAAARAAAAITDWADTGRLARAALEIDPACAEAGALRNQAAEALIAQCMAAAGTAAAQSDRRTAADHAEKALAVDPEADAARRARSSITAWLLTQLLAAAVEGRELGAWEEVLELAQRAARLAPDSEEARELLEDAFLPRLTVVAVVNEEAATGATVSIDGVASRGKTPFTAELEKGRSYRIRVALLSRLGRFLLPFETTYHVEKDGPQSLRAVLEPRAQLVPVLEAGYADLEGLAPGSGEAQERQRAAAQKWALPVEMCTRETGIRLRLVPPGRFRLGSPFSEAGRSDNEGPAVSVTISQPMYVGKSEITQSQWQAVMGNNPSHFRRAGNDAPVESVSWDDCREFCRRLCEAEGVPEGTYRLLTEAEWEYCCRAGALSAYCFGDDPRRLVEYAWYGSEDSASSAPYPAGMKKPNAWGLHDMHGNVYEWCYDLYARYPETAATDPTGPARGAVRVLRGGVFCTSADNCRSASRAWAEPEEPWKWRGLRVLVSGRYIKPLITPTR